MKVRGALHASLYALSLWGLAALFQTGEFHTPLLTGAMFALMVLGFAHWRGVVIPKFPVNVLTIIVFFIFAFLSRRSLIDSVVYFFVFLSLARLATLRFSRDALWLYVVVFFQIVGAAVLTTSLSFAIIFFGYLLLQCVSMLLYSLERGNEVTDKQTRRMHERMASTRGETVGMVPAAAGASMTMRNVGTMWDVRGGVLARVPRGGLLGETALIATLVMATALVFFMITPRLSTRSKLFAPVNPRPPKSSVSAFDESVEFGAVGNINLNTAIAMYVWPLRGAAPNALRLRGVALDNFDGRRWKRTSTSSEGLPFVPSTRQRYLQRQFRIIQPPGITNYLFGPSFPTALRLSVEQPVIYDYLSNAAWLPSTLSREFSYIVDSNLEDGAERRDPVEIVRDIDRQREAAVANDSTNPRDVGQRLMHYARLYRQQSRSGELERNGGLFGFLKRAEQASNDIGPERRRRGLAPFRMPQSYMESVRQFPEALNRERISELARQMMGQADTRFERSSAIERTLRTTFQYSLEQRSTGNFVEDFLFRTKSGHCEYFATAMVMLLRSEGIPARLVNGYYCAEWNSLSQHFTVRQSDAHSWVEVYFDDYGWLTFDPTPASGVGRQVMDREWFPSVTRWADAMTVNWYRYVIDFSAQDQVGVVRGVISLRFRMLEAMERMASSEGGGFNWGTGGGAAGPAAAGGIALLLLAGGVLVLLRIRRRGTATTRRGNRKRRGPGEARSAVAFYAELLAQLARMGLIRAPSETPREFASRVEAREELRGFAPLTEVYYAKRFDEESPLSASDEAVIGSYAQKLKRSARSES